MKYLLSKLHLKSFPAEALVEIQTLDVPTALRWANTNAPRNCLHRHNRLAELSRSFCPLEHKPPYTVRLREGDEALILVAKGRVDNPISPGHLLCCRLVKVRRISGE